MDGQFKKPYEISVWEDELVVQSGQKSYYKENKLAVIGSNTMEGLNKVYEPIFTKKTNGEKILTFSLKYQYFDPHIGATVVNPFASYLINERKIKLKYDNQWYDFIIKDHTESSDGLVWTYTATDAFVNELSKNGYNKEFAAELGNNQDTAINLAKATLEGTDWEVDEEHSSVPPQQISEAIYNASLETVNGLEIVDAETEETQVLSGNIDIYIFYNYVANKDGNFVQFILRESDKSRYVIDDNNTIIASNYRINTPLTYYEIENQQAEVIEKGFKLNNTKIIILGRLETEYQANRFFYGPLTTYDPVLERTVTRYEVNGLSSEVYSYTDYQYSTSDIVTNYISNGENFNTFDNGNLQGWQEVADYSGNTAATTRLITNPPIKADTALETLSSPTQIEGYMEVKFPSIFSNYLNGIFNSGIEDSASVLASITAGQQFVFRWRGGKKSQPIEQWLSNDSLEPMANDNLRVVVAKYKKSDVQKNGIYVNQLDSKNIILDFNSAGTILNNTIGGGIFNDVTTRQITVNGETVTIVDTAKQYVIDNVPVEPSTKYIYTYEGREYIWDSKELKYVLKPNNYCNYYYMIATAKRSISNAELSNPATQIGIFIYTKSEADKYYYFQDIQLTKLYYDNSNKPVTIGNIPEAKIIETDYFYIAPKIGTAANEVEIFTSKQALANELGCSENKIQPKYNSNATKILSINESNSNCYNILQSIAETFECWVDLVVEHNSNGAITLVNGKPNKKVYLREYIGKENFAGFKYGINLNTIERTVNSDEIVTKLIVTPAQSDYVDEGSVAIGYATENPSGEQYILNFDYYYNQGLIADVEVSRADVMSFCESVKLVNNTLASEEEKRRNLEASLVKLNSDRNVYSSLINEAKKQVNEGKQKFERLTGRSYDDYRTLKANIEDLYYFNTTDTTIYKYKDYYEKINGVYQIVTTPKNNPSASPAYYEYLPNLESNNTLIDVIAQIYTNSYAINNYSGVFTNIDIEYKNVRYRIYGTEEFTLTVGVIENANDHTQDHVKVNLNDYVTPFSFRLAGETYSSDVNTKVFDIQTNQTLISDIILPDGYKLYNSNNEVVTTITATSAKLQTFTLKPNVQEYGIDDEIERLQKIKDELVQDFNNKYNRFIQEGTWSSTDYISSNLYYLDALQVSNTSAQPQVTYTINVTEISELEGLEGYNFDAGDKTYIEDTEFFGWSEVSGIRTPAREEVIVSEVEWHLEEPENNVITIQNYKTRFEDLFQRISATVQTVEYNEATYAKTSTLLDAYGTINQSVLLDSLNNISGQPYTLTSDGSIRIDGDAITILDLQNKQNIMRLESSGLKISADGGRTWGTAITGTGINLGEAVFSSLNTDKIIIGSESHPSFRWDQDGLSAYKRNQDSNVYDLETFVRFDQYGLYGIQRNESFVANNLDEVKQKANFAVTWDGFFIKNSYPGGGRVEITSDNDFRVLNTPLSQSEEQEKIKIGALEWEVDGQRTIIPQKSSRPVLYGIRIKNDDGTEVFKTDDDGNITITGTINANAGVFDGLVQVGTGNPYIAIDGEQAEIRSSNYASGGSTGWMIDKEGDAYFMNITARGSIRTAVFEYAEIQAVGGVFLFRPSSTIKSARVDGSNLILKVEKPLLFAKISYNKIDNPSGNPQTQGWYEKTNYGYQLTEDTEIVAEKEYFVKDEITNGSWCKVSNYILDNVPADSTIQNILLTNGLLHVYKVIYVNTATKEVTLQNAASMVTGADAVTTLKELEGGALIDMGREDGTTNYGIGVNSSDNTVNLPRRAISLFETEIKPNAQNDIRVTYNYRGILGTLPELPAAQVKDSIYNRYMAGTQGIYTNNMYLGDDEQFLTFYTDTSDPQNPKKKLQIRANQVVFEVYDKETGEPTGEYQDINDFNPEGTPGPAGQDAISVHLSARPSDTFTNQSGTLLAQAIIMEGTDDISNSASAINNLTWYYMVDGQWKLINNDETNVNGEYHSDGIKTGKLTNEEQDDTFTAVPNGNKQAKFLRVTGSVIEGYGAFKLVASINSGGETLTYTEYINFKDVDDPLYVSLHSTLGEQLVNSQGVGVIYVRVLQGLDPIDELPPDDQIGVGATAPSGTTNTGAFANKLGYCVYKSSDNYMIDYYERSSVSGTWTKRTAPEAKYYWYFRDKNNVSIEYDSSSSSTIPVNLNKLSENNTQNIRKITNQQFVYLTGSVVANKLIADVKVEV